MVDINYYYPYGNRIERDLEYDIESQELDYPDRYDLFDENEIYDYGSRVERSSPPLTSMEIESLNRITESELQYTRKLGRRQTRVYTPVSKFRNKLRRLPSDMCSICLSNLGRRASKVQCNDGCGDIFHETCVQTYGKHKCPICRQRTTFFEFVFKDGKINTL